MQLKPKSVRRSPGTRPRYAATMPPDDVKPVLQLSGQVGKVYRGTVGEWVGGAIVAAAVFGGVKGLMPPTMTLALLIPGLVLGIGSFVYQCVSIRCPSCGLRWFWHEANHGLAADARLAHLSACPRCLYPKRPV